MMKLTIKISVLASSRKKHFHITNNLSLSKKTFYAMVKSIKFSNRRNEFQSNLINDVKKIKESHNLIVAADKTTNLYEMSVNNYKKLLKNNVTLLYQKADDSVLKNINAEAKLIAQSLQLDDRIESYPPRDAFIKLKNDKENFSDHPKCKLINPAKSEIGKISKQFLDNINSYLRKITGFNQWRNTRSFVLDWFNSKHCQILPLCF